MTVRIIQASAFTRGYKRLHNNLKNAVEAAVVTITENPGVGAPKKGGVSGVYVQNFDCVRHPFLLAYEYDPRSRVFLLVGTHENFYRNLMWQYFACHLHRRRKLPYTLRSSKLHIFLEPSGEPPLQEGAPKEQTHGRSGWGLNLSGTEDRGSGAACRMHISYFYIAIYVNFPWDTA